LHPVQERHAQALPDPHAERGSILLFLWPLGVPRPDAADADGGDDERRRIDHHRDRGGQHLDEETCESRPDDAGGGHRQGDLAVRVDETIPLDHRREERVPCRSPERAEDPPERRQDEELPQRKHAEQVRGWDRRHGERRQQVQRHQQATTADAVDPDADEEAEHDRGRLAEHPQQPDLRRRRPEHHDGDDRHRELRDRRSEDRDGLPDPQA
jgi:hypothetical protein